MQRLRVNPLYTHVVLYEPNVVFVFYEDCMNIFACANSTSVEIYEMPFQSIEQRSYSSTHRQDVDMTHFAASLSMQRLNVNA